MAIGKGARLSPSAREKLGLKLERQYAKGRSLSELADEHGTSAGRVRLLLLERGVVLRRRGGAVRKPDPSRAARARDVARRYDAGATLAELAAQEGVSASTVRNLVERAGGRLRPRGSRPARGD